MLNFLGCNFDGFFLFESIQISVLVMQISYNNKFDAIAVLWPMAFLTHFPNLKIPRTRERVKYPIQGNWDRSVFSFLWWDMLLLKKQILHYLLSIKPYKKWDTSVPLRVINRSSGTTRPRHLPGHPLAVSSRTVTWSTHLLREKPNKPFSPQKPGDLLRRWLHSKSWTYDICPFWWLV